MGSMDTTRTHYSSSDGAPTIDHASGHPPLHVPSGIRITFNCPACDGKIETEASPSAIEFACPHCGSIIMTPAIGFGAGMTLDDFKLIRRIGRGAMGEVYLAKQQSLSRHVAVKIMSPQMTSSPEQVERFRREVQNLARLYHPNIVTAFYAGTHHDIHYLAMTYVDGESVQARIQQWKQLDEEEALSVIDKVGDALRYAWDEFGFVHRDIKPANIMIDGSGEVKLTDLGLSKFVYEESSDTHGHRIFGTPQYMSPEQTRGERDLDFRSDMYSLGITFYHMLAGRPPFDDEDIGRVLDRQQRATPPPIRDFCPHLSAGSEAILQRLLQKNPNDRYDSWDDLLHAIAETLAVLPPPGQRTSPAAYQTQEVLLDATLRRRRQRRYAGLAALLIAGVIGWLVWDYQRTQPEEFSVPDFVQQALDSAFASPDHLNTAIDVVRDQLGRAAGATEQAYLQWSKQRLQRERRKRIDEVLEHLDDRARAYLHAGLPDFAVDVYLEYDGPWAEESHAARLERAEAYIRPPQPRPTDPPTVELPAMVPGSERPRVRDRDTGPKLTPETGRGSTSAP